MMRNRRRYVPATDLAPITYQGVEITYKEAENHWAFTLRGVDRTATSLANAKIAIDRPPPKDKKRFEECFAYYERLYTNERPEKVRVTGLAKKGRWTNRQEVWIVGVGKEKTRRKVELGYLLAATPANVKLFEAWEEIEKEVEERTDRQRQIVAKYQKFTLPDNLEDGKEEEEG